MGNSPIFTATFVCDDVSPVVSRRIATLQNALTDSTEVPVSRALVAAFAADHHMRSSLACQAPIWFACSRHITSIGLPELQFLTAV
jgi:hypothetical protein